MYCARELNSFMMHHICIVSHRIRCGEHQHSGWNRSPCVSCTTQRVRIARHTNTSSIPARSNSETATGVYVAGHLRRLQVRCRRFHTRSFALATLAAKNMISRVLFAQPPRYAQTNAYMNVNRPAEVQAGAFAECAVSQGEAHRGQLRAEQ